MGKTIKERIDRFCEKYPEPRQYKIRLRWNRKDGEHLAVVGSGEDLVINSWRTCIYTRSVCKKMYIQHYRYDAETQLMECSYAVISCLTPKENDNRRWEYAERYFIPKGEKQVYDINGNANSYKVHQSYEWTATHARAFLQGFTRIDCPVNSFEKEFNALTDGVITVPPRYNRSVYHPWILTEWIRYNAKPRSENGKTQQRIDKMLEKELDDTDDIIETVSVYFEEHQGNYNYGCYRLAYFDKANMVFRLFYKYFDTFKEEKRVYIDGKKFLFATPKGDKWVTNGSFTSSQFGYTIINMEDVYNLPHCGYLRNFSKANTVYKVVSIMRNAEIEQLHNMGMTNLANKLIGGESVAVNLKEYFGDPDKKKKNMCQRYHITKKQLDFINTNETNTSYYTWDRLRNMKELLNTNDLSSIDIESFKKYYNMTKNAWHVRVLNDFSPENRKKLLARIANMSAKHDDAMQVFYDTYNMARNNIDFMSIHTYEELVRAHDAAMEIRRIEMEERRRLSAMRQEERNKELEKKMEKLDKERAKLNYEEDDFIIRLPEKLSEIAMEGNALRHCVGGYTDRHAMGNTTILFLRRKSEPDKSFYTIEVNRNNIIQIHGFGNRWLGCNPEAIPTVARWLKKNGIHCTDQILRSKATGYCGNSDLVPMPAI